ncbi:hypothetical protein [Methylocapsa palsarum]|uniref:Threonine aldolase n=1 Tax=Methylocapsa palsarum TaxID=1612308 RepID=A0A1I4ASK5_9HYPH|nr:hypothetical protein [Methylocapsa palsarum]SFK58636.1 threonine aldolase [Methylocapsa palsarum]
MAMLAEAVIFFDRRLATDFAYIRKRAGQLASKQRYISAQLLALIEDGLWLRNAAIANSAAKRLADALRHIPQVKMHFPADANVLFVEMPKALADSLLANGHEFYHWPLLGQDVYRLVASFNTTESEVDSFVDDCKAIGL